MQQPAIFLDDGGVMNDNARRGPQWQRLVADFFPPLLGGDPAAWAEANRVVATALFADYSRTMAGRDDADYLAWLHGYRIAWMRHMCAYMGVPSPSEEDCRDLSERASMYVTTRVRADIAGVIEALRALHDRGHTLHTASGEESGELHGYLTGMGVRDCFTGLYGPDLINTPKEGPRYYERVFADAGLDPRDAVVVDDFPAALRWAAVLGARTVLVRSDRSDSDDADLVLDALRDLPAALHGPEALTRGT
jgi:HAD superfamily hydrolase (TIGR01509 family)